MIFDINVQIALFRDLLIHVGTTKDGPELREKIRRVRRQCVEGCQQTNNQLLPQVKRWVWKQIELYIDSEFLIDLLFVFSIT